MKELDINRMVLLYNKDISVYEISKEFNVDVGTIYSRLKKLGIYKRRRKFKLNEDYFENINNQNKAYWLGFIMADGYNSGSYIRIDIQDKGHLEILRDDIYPNKDRQIKIKISRTNKEIYYLTIQSKKIVKDCENLGIVQRKTFVTKYPIIDSKFDKDFIRGLFDGDGCLTYSMDGNYRRYTLTILGTKDLVLEIKNIISKLGINIGFRKTRSIFEISIRGNRQIIKLLNWLYDGSETSMIRKFKKYQDFIEWDLS